MAIIKIRNAAIDLDAAEIPNLPATKITSGTLDNARISLDAAEIPNLDTAKITTGTLADARLPANALNSNVSVPNQSAFKNIIINGDMSIAQRATSVTGATSGGYLTCDRWNVILTTAGTYSISQSSDNPDGKGFAKSMKFDCTTADASLAAGDNLRLQGKFEGQNLQYLKKGTGEAQSLALSFWVKSNKTGTYIVELEDKDNTRKISKSYTINVANTWEKKTLTYAGDTTGAFNNDNARSLDLMFWLAAGSTFSGGSTLNTSWGAPSTADRAVGQVNLGDSTSNEWYITGVQLEAGTSASDFEFLPFDVNLKRCQRYYSVICDLRTSGAYPIRDQRSIGIGTTHYPNQVSVCMIFPTEMRTVPSIDQVTGTNYYLYYHETTSDYFDSFNSIGGNGVTTMIMRNTNQISASHGVSGTVTGDSNGNSFVAFEAEL